MADAMRAVEGLTSRGTTQTWVTRRLVLAAVPPARPKTGPVV